MKLECAKAVSISKTDYTRGQYTDLSYGTVTRPIFDTRLSKLSRNVSMGTEKYGEEQDVPTSRC